jgi:Outer membrane protein beta-barrel domain
MKKTIRTIIYGALCSLCIFVSVDGFSQQQEASGETGLTPKFGIKGGLNLSNLYINDVQDENVKLGGHFGVFAKLPIATGVSIMPELLYSNKGTKATYNNSFQGSGEYRFNLNYIELPLSFVFNIVKNFNVHAGGYAAYLTSANVKNLHDGNIDGVTDLNAENFNRADFGLLGGIGLDIDNVTIGARYSYGLRQVGQSGSLSGELTKDSKNSNLSMYIGIAF